MSRPLDHIDERAPFESSDEITQPKLSATGWARWVWRQLTSMRTALFLLLLLALAAIPGSLVPQRSADPNGVVQYYKANPTLASVLDSLQAFDTFKSFWFSSIYLLLFISLIGCVIPRAVHHFRSLRAAPPRTPARLSRLSGFTSYVIAPGSRDADSELITGASAVEAARVLLRRRRYRIIVFDRSQPGKSSETSVSAERGYLREAGNLVFHIALLGILIAVGIGGGFGFTGNRVVVEGQSMINTLAAYDSFNPGRFFNTETLAPFSLTLDKLDVTYETSNVNAFGQPIDYVAHVTTQRQGSQTNDESTIRVNQPLSIGGSEIYLLGNGYAPRITVRDPLEQVVFSDVVPFLPQDANLTSLGVVKVPDGLADQVGMIGFFYPTKVTATSGAFFSTYPDLIDPVLTLNVFSGDLGLDAGVPRSVYALDTSQLTQLTGGSSGVKSVELRPGQTQELPNGLGSVSFDSVSRFASFEIHSDPAQGWVLLFAIAALAGLFTSLFIPRRRMWVKATQDAGGSVRLEYAGLARGEDPQLEAAISDLATAHASSLGVDQLLAAAPEDAPSGSHVDREESS